MLVKVRPLDADGTPIGNTRRIEAESLFDAVRQACAEENPVPLLYQVEGPDQTWHVRTGRALAARPAVKQSELFATTPEAF